MGVKLARLGVRAKIYALQKARVPSSPATAKDLEGMHCTDTKNVWLLNALLLMTIRPAYIRVRQYTESNFV